MNTLDAFDAALQRESVARVKAGKSAEVPGDIAVLIARSLRTADVPNCQCPVCKGPSQ